MEIIIKKEGEKETGKAKTKGLDRTREGRKRAKAERNRGARAERGNTSSTQSCQFPLLIKKLRLQQNKYHNNELPSFVVVGWRQSSSLSLLSFSLSISPLQANDRTAMAQLAHAFKGELELPSTGNEQLSVSHA